MLKRHQELLETALEDLLHDPVVKISKKKAKYWVGSERARNAFWKALMDRLPEGVESENVAVLEEGDDIYLRHRNSNKWKNLANMN